MMIFSTGETIQFDWSDGIIEGGVIGWYEVLQDFIDVEVMKEFETTGEHPDEFVKFLEYSSYVKRIEPDHTWCPEECGRLNECHS